MDFLTEEQLMWRDTVARVMKDEITCAYVRECDTERRYPYEAYEKVAKLGWLRLLIPEEQGGDGGTIFDYALMCEGLARYGFDFATAFMVSTFTAMNLVKFGTQAQRDAYLGPFMRGERRFSISISEPSAGSDAANTRTRAERDGGDWVINGQKLWCSGAAAKNVTIAMLVRTDGEAKKHQGLSVMLVPNDTPGLEIRRNPRHATTKAANAEPGAIHKNQIICSARSMCRSSQSCPVSSTRPRTGL